jgi:uncharacterized phiE125 gp8 family phage protein
MGRVLDAAPDEEPITTAEAKLHLREDSAAQDTLIASLIVAARENVEAFTHRALVEQSWMLTLDEFPCDNGPIVLPFPPLISVEEVRYLDGDGIQRVLDDGEYVVDITSIFGKIDLAYSKYWPVTLVQPNAIEVDFTCGYGAAEDVPERAKAAMKLWVGQLYENRESSETPLGVDSLLWPLRVEEAA